jgi:hypothetical protein
MQPVDIELELSVETVNDGLDEIITLRLGEGEAVLVVELDPGAPQHRGALLARSDALGARFIEALAERAGLLLPPPDEVRGGRNLFPVRVAHLLPHEVEERHGVDHARWPRLEIQLMGDLFCDLDIDPGQGWACLRQLTPDHVGLLALGLRPTDAPPAEPSPPRERPPWAPTDTYVLMEHDSGVSLGGWVERTGLTEAELTVRLDEAAAARFAESEQRIEAALTPLTRGEPGALDSLFTLGFPYAIAHTLQLIPEGGVGDDAIAALRKRLRAGALRALLLELQEPAGIEEWLGLTQTVSDELIARLRSIAEHTASIPEAEGLPEAIAAAAEALAGGELPETSHGQILARLERIERLVDIGAPTIILANELLTLARVLPAGD